MCWPSCGLERGIVKLKEKSHRRDSNPRPIAYEAIALPAELRWRVVNPDAADYTRGEVGLARESIKLDK